jgi:hypothetical protein
MCIIKYIYYIREPLRAPNILYNNIYYTIGDTMLEVFFGVLLAIAVRDLYLELIERYRNYRFKKDLKVFADQLEDLEADDDDDLK